MCGPILGPAVSIELKPTVDQLQWVDAEENVQGAPASVIGYNDEAAIVEATRPR